MTDLVVFDTNIYFYALDTTSAEKFAIANNLIRNVSDDRTVIVLQVMGELANAITKRRPDLVPSVKSLMNDIAAVASPTQSEDIRSALAVHKQHGMQFWDAVIWATARRAGCTLLFTEDYQDGRIVDGVVFRNPFLLSPADLTTLLA